MFADIKKLIKQLFIGKGVKTTSKKVYKERLSICRANTCKSYKNPLKLGLFENCGECGCFLRIKNRIDEFYIQCPKKLW